MANKDGTIKTTIILKSELHDKIKELAAADARSVNSLIIKLLQDYVKDHA